MVSFTMCVIAVSAVLVLKLYKSFSYRLAAYQVLSSLFFSLSQVLTLTLLGYNGSEYYRVACKLDAFLIQYTIWVKLLFTSCLSFHFFCLTVCLRNFENLELLYVLISLLFPLLFSWIPFIHDLYGLAGAWCWIKEWRHDCASEHYFEGIMEQFLLWYGPQFITLSVLNVCFLIIPIVFAWKMYRWNNSSESECLLGKEKHQKIKGAVKRLLPLLAYPIIFYVLAILPLIHRIYTAVSHFENYDLAMAHAVTQTSWGFFSSWALIIHILMIQGIIKKKKKKRMIHTRTVTAYSETVIFTTSNSTTCHIPPEESDVDILF